MFFDYDEFVIQTLQFANRFEWTSKGLVLKADDFFLGAALIPATGTVTPPISINPPVVSPPVVPPVPVITYIPEVTKPVVIPTPIYTPVDPPKPVTPPVVVLPGVSFFSLKGIYRLEISQSNLNTILLTFDDEYVQF